MNIQILKLYGISFYKPTNGFYKIEANSPNLSIYLNRLTANKDIIPDFINNIDVALSGNYNTIEDGKFEWHLELGTHIYTGIINSDLSFNLFIEDHYDETIETFPLLDIREIIIFLLKFINSH